MSDSDYIRAQLSHARPLANRDDTPVRLQASSVAGESKWVNITAEAFDAVILAATGAPDPLRALFSRRWECRVVVSGYNNGAGCTPGDPHDPGWHCAWRWTCKLTDAQAKRLGLTSEED